MRTGLTFAAGGSRHKPEKGTRAAVGHAGGPPKKLTTTAKGSQHPSSTAEERLRVVMAWFAVVATTLLGTAAFALMLWRGFRDQAWLSIAQQNFAAVAGLPTAALAALFVVLVLRITAGPIEVELGPLKFKGAAAPVVFWLICFLAIALMIKFLWVTR